MNQRLRAKRQMRLAASGRSAYHRFEQGMRLAIGPAMRMPWPRGLNKPKGAK